MDSDNDSYHSENEFYYPDEENVLQENKNKLKMAAVQPKICLQSTLRKKKNKDVICGPRSVRIGKNCALGLEYDRLPAASGRTQDLSRPSV